MLALGNKIKDKVLPRKAGTIVGYGVQRDRGINTLDELYIVLLDKELAPEDTVIIRLVTIDAVNAEIL